MDRISSKLTVTVKVLSKTQYKTHHISLYIKDSWKIQRNFPRLTARQASFG